MTRLDLDMMQKFVEIYRTRLGKPDLPQLGAKSVMRNYVADMEALLAYIKELEASNAG
jgi:hypothetical protein